MLTNELKLKVIKALKVALGTFGGTDSKFAASIGMNASQWSRIKKGETEKVISEAKWITLARQYNVQLDNKTPWRTAVTPVYQYITEQLENCRINSISCLLCDIADIGKTYAAKVYAQAHKHCVYVDCSQVKTKQQLIRYIAQQFGVNHTGRYKDVYADLVYYLRSIQNPLVILDEAGDLKYDAFLELKALWNATERACAWCMMGADGLKVKIERSIEFKKVGYTEIFSRYGNRYQKISPDASEERKKFLRAQAAIIIQANAKPGTDVQKIIRSTNGSLRRIYTELQKAI